ncbi:MAG: hypothetical protein ACP5LJ_05165 [Candidatus Bipolaricaulaceae bacterium]
MKVGDIYLVVAGALLALSTIRNRKKTVAALITSGKVTLQVLPVLFFIFVLMGTIEAFVSKNTIAHLLGTGSGVRGILLSEVVGSMALIEPAAVFPFSGYLRTNGASYGTVAAFVLSAILIGISTLPLEVKLFGLRFTLTRNLLTFAVIFFLAILMGVII